MLRKIIRFFYCNGLLCAVLFGATAASGCLVSQSPCENGDLECNPVSLALLTHAGAPDTEYLRYLILDDSTNNKLLVYGFNDDNPEQNSDLSLAATPNWLGLHPGKLYVLAANTTLTETFSLDIDSGDLTLVDSDTVGGNQVGAHPSGDFVFSSDLAGNVQTHDFAAGELNQESSVAPGNATSSLVSSADGSLLFVTQAGGPDNVTPYAVDSSTGALNAGTAFTMTGGYAPTSSRLHPSLTEVLYAFPSGTSLIEVFSVDTSAVSLSSIQQATTTASPAAGDITPDGKYLFSGTSTGFIDRYSVDGTTGQLTSLGNFSTGAGAVTGMRIDPTGAYVFIATSTPNQVLQYSIEADGTLLIKNTISTGVLTVAPVIVAY